MIFFVDDKYTLFNIDFTSGFYQIEIEFKDVKNTAFSIKNNHYEFVLMPFGSKIASRTYQKIERVLLNEVLQTSSKVNLKIQPN